jgi:hypothetical protein
LQTLPSCRFSTWSKGIASIDGAIEVVVNVNVNVAGCDVNGGVICFGLLRCCAQLAMLLGSANRVDDCWFDAPKPVLSTLAACDAFTACLL